MNPHFEYALAIAGSWDELKGRLSDADKEGWQAVGYAVADGRHQALLKRERRRDDKERREAKGPASGTAKVDWLL